MLCGHAVIVDDGFGCSEEDGCGGEEGRRWLLMATLLMEKEVQAEKREQPMIYFFIRYCCYG